MASPLTLDQLRVLVAIDDAGSFSAAGRALDRAQSAVSQAVQTLEEMQGVSLFDRAGHRPVFTRAGRVLVEQARLVLAGALQFEAVAAGARAGLEAELTLAIDPLVPTAPLIASLRSLSETFPQLPVNFRTEGLGGAERRLRDGKASLAVCLLLPTVPAEIMAFPLLDLQLVPVAAPAHPLAKIRRPLQRLDLESEVQLVLSDPLAGDGGDHGPGFGIVGARLWRFVDLARRLDFLLAGFGWCKMPRHLVEPYVRDGALVRLDITDESVLPSTRLLVYAAHLRHTPPGPAGSWLLADLRRRLPFDE